MRVAALISENVRPGSPIRRQDAYEPDRQFAALTPACRDVGINLVPIVWDAQSTDGFDAVVIGPTWDYTSKPTKFLERLRAIEAERPLFNPSSLVAWNLRKTYLWDLSNAGVPVVPSFWPETLDEDFLDGLFDLTRSDDVVIKRVVGESAIGQVRWRRGDARPHLSTPEGWFVQPFIPSIQTFGEIGVLVFGGTPSHAVRKIPSSADYRVQSLYGGHDERFEPDASVLDAVRRAVAALPAPALYARVDLLDVDGVWAVSEVELVEPYYYPEFAPGCGVAFARALVEALKSLL
jgi:glutathione synthase/RimK-type ligase-like ATP-grasp enzyme